MLIDQVFLYFLIAAGVIVSMPALWLLMRARWPERVRKLHEVSNRSVILSFFAGLPVLALVIGLIALVVRAGKRMDLPIVFFSAFLAVLIAVAALAGLAGLATMIGERLSSTNGTAEPWKTTLRGGIVLVCLLSMPYVGWFALLPVSVITGGGMMLRSFFVRSTYQVPSFASVPAPPAIPTSSATPII